MQDKLIPFCPLFPLKVTNQPHDGRQAVHFFLNWVWSWTISSFKSNVSKNLKVWHIYGSQEAVKSPSDYQIAKVLLFSLPLWPICVLNLSVLPPRVLPDVLYCSFGYISKKSFRALSKRWQRDSSEHILFFSVIICCQENARFWS
jgi:hypothetical protein